MARIGKIDIIGGKKVITNFDTVAHLLSKKVIRNLIPVAYGMQKYMRRQIRNTPRMRRFYKRGTRIHRPSKSYKFPAYDSGNLWRNIVVNTDILRQKLQVGTLTHEVPYAEFLERGTNKMRKRPFAKPTLQKTAPHIMENIINSTKEAFTNAIR